MRKPDSLRQALETAIPDLARNPQQLKIWLDNGRVQSFGRGGPMAIGYRYKLSLMVLDFAASEPHTLFAAIVAWLAIEQPDVLLRPLDPDSGITFEIEVLDDNKVDVLITLQLDESAASCGNGAIGILAEPMLDSDELLSPGAVLQP